MLNLILFGPPGSGKGTQAIKLAEAYDILHISTGDLFRSEMKNETELGLEAKSYMAKGKLVPDAVTIGMLRNKVESTRDVQGYIFDGFPRTINQAEALDSLLSSLGQDISGLIALEVDEQEIVDRLLLRGRDSGRADDRDESVIRKRLRVYEEETSPVFEYYDNQNKANKVNGMGTVGDIFSRLKELIDTLPR